jgi:hypothetical protein
MDAGDARPFRERVEIGAGHGRFCAEDYDYLRVILPTSAPADQSSRPGCS